MKNLLEQVKALLVGLVCKVKEAVAGLLVKLADKLR